MILERTFYNNGYGCSCCRRDEEITDWIEESDMKSFEEILDEALNEGYKSASSDGGIVGRVYEKDGNVLYGYESSIYKTGADMFIVFGDEELRVKSSIDNRCLDGWEVTEKYQQSLR